MNTVLLHNPDAGERQPSIGRLLRLLARHGYSTRYCSIKHQYAEASLAASPQPELVIVAGGDGTLGKVSSHLVCKPWQVALLPLGTANNVATTLGIQGSLDEVVDSWRSAESIPVDCGLVEGLGPPRYFFESLGVGFFAHAMAMAKSAGKRQHFSSPEEKLRFERRIVCAADADSAPVTCRITSSSGSQSGEFLAVELVNGPLIGPRLALAPEALMSDGALDLALWRRDELAELNRWLQSACSSVEETPARRPKRTALVELSLAAADVHIDGTLFSIEDVRQQIAPDRTRLELAVSVIPGALSIRAPVRSATMRTGNS